MILISHRGNINGRFESCENEPTYVDEAIKDGYDVEVDVWVIDGVLYLGHDKHQYDVDLRWFRDRLEKLWIHCKNVDAINFFRDSKYRFNYFWHETDTITLTSLNYIWAYPGKQPIEKSIAVLPEIFSDTLDKCSGVCSDYVSKYKKSENIL